MTENVQTVINGHLSICPDLETLPENTLQSFASVYTRLCNPDTFSLKDAICHLDFLRIHCIDMAHIGFWSDMVDSLN